MNNSLVTMRVINEEVKMKREEIKDYQNQSKMLVANLTRIKGAAHVVENHSILVDSVKGYK